MKNFKVKNTEIVDYNGEVDGQEGNAQLSYISVLVEVAIDNIEVYLDYQTTQTHDYGAISTSLSAYQDSGYEELKELVNDEDELDELLDSIAQEAKVQKIYDDYVEEHYIRDESHFGGLDANSEINECVKK